MSPSTRLGSGISRYRAVVAALFTVAASLYVAFVSIPPLVVIVAVIAVVYSVASAFDTVRTHPLYNLASAVFAALLFGLWYVASNTDGLFLLALTVLSAFGVAVEAYNYRHGTSYLRLDF
ncbi:hypothetical protein [Halopelagius longus]|uniref:Phosphatidate cytidylyltransferase n=1 Tax=Halopelagius longus TaxID=1236180 RepID=A0A1H1B817_9EURY|nr:hypothetical protein [Halopelagius longus]RDI70679.1 phosphatidate cytidylyltransferase [Halopelagius longus]SDQ48033.1 hypothetical protein SAMN05216278_1678 [Halopelagius longus]